MRKILATLGVSALMGTSLIAAGTGTAWATLEDCPSGWICLWQDGPFVNGRMLKFNAPGTYHLGDYGFNDQMSSWANKTSQSACWYEHGDPISGRHGMPAGSSSAVVNPNDEASVLVIGNC